MKETKITKRIFAVFVAFIAILLISCGDLQVFADNFTLIPYGVDNAVRVFYWPSVNTYVDFYKSSDSSDNFYVSAYYVDNVVHFYLLGFSAGSSGLLCSISNNNNYTYSFDSLHWQKTFNSDYYGVVYVWGIEYPRTSATATVNVHIYSSKDDMLNAFYYSFYPVVTPSPAPTPTPTPASTPTPLPVDYDDTQFWGRVNDMAEGGWSAITATFNGIFNNTVFRNLVVYVPLFGAIIYLFVYLLFMGSD